MSGYCTIGHRLTSNYYLTQFFLQTLAKQKREDETPQVWRARVEEKLEPPGIPLRSYGGQSLNIVGKVTVDIRRGAHKASVRVHVQQGAPGRN